MKDGKSPETHQIVSVDVSCPEPSDRTHAQLESAEQEEAMVEDPESLDISSVKNKDQKVENNNTKEKIYISDSLKDSKKCSKSLENKSIETEDSEQQLSNNENYSQVEDECSKSFEKEENCSEINENYLKFANQCFQDKDTEMKASEQCSQSNAVGVTDQEHCSKSKETGLQMADLMLHLNLVKE